MQLRTGALRHIQYGRSIDYLISYYCALESQQQVICDKVGERCEGKYEIRFPTPSDLHAVGYVIFNTTHPVTKISLFDLRDNSTDITDFLKCILHKDFSLLQRLELTTKINSVLALALSDILKSCTHLSKLGLSFHEISHDSAKAIANRLEYLTSLQDVTIKCFSTSGGITTLLSGFAHLTSTKLDLYFYDLDTRNIFEIGSGLQLFTNNNLCRLVLQRCIIDGDAATALANGLHSNVNNYTPSGYIR